MGQEILLAFFPNARNIVEYGSELTLAAQRTVVGDGEAVAFVAHALDEIEGVGLARQDDRFVFVFFEEKLFLFGESEGWNVCIALFAHGAAGVAELAFAAVDDDEIWQPGEFAHFHAAFELFGGVVEAAGDDFVHAGKVVWSFDGFDLKMTVLAFGWFSGDKNDHGGDGVGALDVGNVIALDAVGQMIETEIVFEIDERAFCALTSDVTGDDAFGQRFLGVAPDEIHEGAGLALLWDVELHFCAVFFAEQLLQGFLVVKMLVDVDRSRYGFLLEIELLHKAGEHFFVAVVLAGVERVGFATENFSAAHEKYLHHGAEIVARHCHEVVVAGALAGRFLAIADGVDGADLIALLGGCLKIEGVGGGEHFLLETIAHRRCMAVKKICDLFDHGVVVVSGNMADAWSFAESEMFIETAHGFVELRVAAGAKRKDAMRKLQGVAQFADVCVGAEVAGAVADDLSRHEDARIILFGDAQVGVGFPVFEVDVVFWAVFFDQVAFEYQRFCLVVDDDVFQILDVTHERLCFHRFFWLRAKIRTHAVFQIDRLADVDDLAVFVFHKIDAGIRRQGCKLLLDDVVHR